jgi:hypothetical protein
LPAAAAAAARSIPELLQIGSQLIAVVFRLGLATWRRALNIENQPGHWSMAVKSDVKKLQKTADRFNSSRVCLLNTLMPSNLAYYA